VAQPDHPRRLGAARSHAQQPAAAERHEGVPVEDLDAQPGEGTDLAGRLVPRWPPPAARGIGHGRNRRDREKAEIFERALARVSRRIATVASRAAPDLRAEHLAAARTEGTGPETRGCSTDHSPAGRKPPAAKATGGTKRDASTRAQATKRQARQDNR
jgi:hypothetical protein